MRRNYDSTVAQMAMNIARDLAQDGTTYRQNRKDVTEETIARKAVRLARLIIAEVKRTESKPTPEAPDR